MFRQGNAPPPASKKFVDSLEDVKLVNDEGTDTISSIIGNLRLVYNNYDCFLIYYKLLS